ncbi:MAG: hypothetical protein CL928_01545 [Deltaproteobacteria bacterium]|nr:hypothetical protein [Deltaproteobacteria bacterium]
MGWTDTNQEWRVHPHGEWVELGEHAWAIRGELPDMPLGRWMVVARQEDGRLVIHNAMALDESCMSTLDSWGEVGRIIVPNGLHRLDSPAFAARYPEAEVYCPSGALKRVSKVVSVAGVLAEFPHDARVKYQALPGTGGAEGVLHITGSDGATLVFTDAIFNLPHQPGVQGWFYRWVTASTGGPKVTRVFRLMCVKDGPLLAKTLHELANTPDLRRIIVAHGDIIDQGPSEVLRSVADTV